jgi:uncharacterized protein YjiS (DUF1127 family)
MNDGLTLLPRADQALWPASPAETAEMKGRRYNPAALREIIALWRRRICFRWELARLAKHCPELIDDLGLTMGDIERETEKPFWRR